MGILFVIGSVVTIYLAKGGKFNSGRFIELYVNLWINWKPLRTMVLCFGLFLVLGCTSFLIYGVIKLDNFVIMEVLILILTVLTIVKDIY